MYLFKTCYPTLFFVTTPSEEFYLNEQDTQKKGRELLTVPSYYPFSVETSISVTPYYFVIFLL